MTTKQGRRTLKRSMALLAGASITALSQAAAQEETAGQQPLAQGQGETEVITVTGIRSSLISSRDMKRDAQGVVDAISAEDIGSFPDTNLAEALQRITGVSIDRENGEGSRVTVRGFGPDYNLVLLNGRQMPTSSLQATSASSSRSFDFGNLAADGISAVEVYKTGRPELATGGIGSTINIRTTRPLDSPGLRASAAVGGMYDLSPPEGENVTPEFTGIFSNTFADDRIGVSLSANYQERRSGFAQAAANSGWRGAFLGSEADWGTLPEMGDITNRPGPNDVYSVPQNMNYSINEIDRERFNGQLTLQARPTDRVTVTADYTYSENRIATRRSDMSIWFNFEDTSSAWTDGPVAGPIFYTERFGGAPSDLSMGGGQFAVKNELNSAGLNVEWEATDNLTFEFDYHNSSARSGSNSPYGSDAVIGTAGFYLASQSVNFEQDLPVISLGYIDGVTGIDPSLHVSTGTSFRNGLMQTDIEQARIMGRYQFDRGIIDSIGFGAERTENDVRSAFAVAQRDTWGGVGSPSDIPDDIWRPISVSSVFDRLGGSGSPDLVPTFYAFDFDRMAAIIDSEYNACGGDGICRSDDFTTDRRTNEETFAAYAQVNTAWDIADRPFSAIFGLRYEQTDVTSRALVPVPVGTQWVSENEFGVIYSDQSAFTELEGSYDYWLPSVDLRYDIREDITLRASYSQTITRPGYADIQGGQTVTQLFRVFGGTGEQGDPGLLPYESQNFDLSAEWYYAPGSYVSAGYFRKDVDNFIGRSVIEDSPFELYHPAQGARYQAAVAALGPNAGLTEIRNWIFENADPSTVEITGVDSNGNITGNIFGVPGEDPLVVFEIGVPVNERSASVDGWEFAWQHLLGDTGFGFILNYTIVNGDVNFDNTLPRSAPGQFALIGLSDSANLVAFYDRDGIQVRAAYNWRDRFLNALNNATGEPNNPMYTEAYGQLDLSASYQVTDNLQVFAEGINVTDETQRIHGRHPFEANFVTQTGARYGFGVRYTF